MADNIRMLYASLFTNVISIVVLIVSGLSELLYVCYDESERECRHWRRTLKVVPHGVRFPSSVSMVIKLK